MPERFKVVFTMQGAIQVLGFTFFCCYAVFDSSLFSVRASAH